MLDELLYTEMTAVDLLRAWYPPPPLTVPLPPLELKCRLTEPELHYQLRFWTEGDAVPDWESVDTFIEPGLALPTLRLAYTYIHKSDSGGSVTRTQGFDQIRWRWRWRVPVEPMAWRFVHLRWRPEYTVNEGESPIVVGHGDVEELWWTGAVPTGYDADDLETWPGTEWEEVPIPDCPEPDDPETGSATVVEAWTFMQGVWPRPDDWVAYPPTEVLRAPGLIPGASEPAHCYQRPHSRGLTYGYFPAEP